MNDVATMTFVEMLHRLRAVDYSSIPAQQSEADAIKRRLDAEHPGWRAW